jgi:hypothetical protein
MKSDTEDLGCTLIINGHGSCEEGQEIGAGFYKTLCLSPPGLMVSGLQHIHLMQAYANASIEERIGLFDTLKNCSYILGTTRVNATGRDLIYEHNIQAADNLLAEQVTVGGKPLDVVLDSLSSRPNVFRRAFNALRDKPDVSMELIIADYYQETGKAVYDAEERFIRPRIKKMLHLDNAPNNKIIDKSLATSL